MIGALGRVPDGCLTRREREVAEQVCQQTLPQVRGLGQEPSAELVALDLAQRYPGVHACDLLGMRDCVPRLRTSDRDTTTGTIRFFDITPDDGLVEVPEAEEEEEDRRTAYAVGGVLLLLLVGGGGYALYRARKRR